MQLHSKRDVIIPTSDIRIQGSEMSCNLPETTELVKLEWQFWDCRSSSNSVASTLSAVPHYHQSASVTLTG